MSLRSRICTGNCPHQFGPASADEACNTKNFAGTHIEADIAKCVVDACQSFDLEHDLLAGLR